MNIAEGVEWALHCCTVLASVPPGASLTASQLAQYHGVPAAYLAKHLQALAAAGVVASVPGRAGGYRLARGAGSVTLLEVVQAIEGAAPAFRCTEIRRRGCGRGLPGNAFPRPCRIAAAMARAEEAWRGVLAARTIGDLLEEFEQSVDPRVRRRAHAWLEEALQ